MYPMTPLSLAPRSPGFPRVESDRYFRSSRIPRELRQIDICSARCWRNAAIMVGNRVLDEKSASCFWAMSPSMTESRRSSLRLPFGAELGADQSVLDPAVCLSLAEARNLLKFAIGENEVSGIGLVVS